MSDAVLRLIMLAGLFLFLFALAEWLHQKRNLPAEHTRKLVHAGTGLLTLLFPVWLQQGWPVALLCGSFLLLLAVSKRARFLNSIHDVQRTTHGSLLYPVIVAIVFYYYLHSREHYRSFHPFYYFYMPVLIMAVADPAAALAGRRYQQKWGVVSGKTHIGSLAFLSVALLTLIILMVLFIQNKFDPVAHGALLFSLSLTGTGAEYISRKGWDNFFIPLVLMIVQTLFEYLV
jgi:dolichol kinase